VELRAFIEQLLNAPVAAVILASTMAVSIIAFRRPAMLRGMMLNPYRIVGQRRPLTILTYGLVHADWLHLLFNMVALYSISFQMEELAGPVRFLMIYAGSYLLGVIPTIIRQSGNPGYRSLGASAAVSGVFFAGLVYFPTSRIMMFLLPVPLPYPVFAVMFVAVSWYGARRNLGNIGHESHLYGALSGLVLTLLVDPDAAQLAVRSLLA
jgi:membrane associated rhomboid family serine protease